MSLALGFVFLSLLALVAIPVAVDRRIAEFRRSVRDLSEPARSEVTELHVALATAGSLLSDFVNTGDIELLERYQNATAGEMNAHSRLAAFAGPLSSAVLDQHRAVLTLSSRWHGSVAELVERLPAAPAQLAEQQSQYEDLLVAVAELDRSITLETERRRHIIAAAEQLQIRVTLVLATVALLAAFFVSWLGRSLRVYAEEAERGHREVKREMETKARMIRGFSHDVKNPLGAADGYAELLEDGILGPLSPGQQDGLARMRGSLRAALRIIEDLVELSRVDAGQLEISRNPINVVKMIEEVLDEHRAEASAAAVVLNTALSNELPEIVTDGARVHQILGNLLSNVSKYAKGGRVTIAAEIRNQEGKPPQGGWLLISVKDSGPGIPAQQHEAVFEEFTRIDPGTQPGAGLGLAISRRVARLLGGDLTVESAEGLGATFTIWLPVVEP